MDRQVPIDEKSLPPSTGAPSAPESRAFTPRRPGDRLPGALNAKQLAKLRTHRRLLDATIELVREHGAGAVNTVKVTERAGVAQSVFYAHFESVAACLTEAATDVVERVDKLNARIREEQNLEARTVEELLDIDGMTDAFERSLAIMVENAEFVDIFIRFVRDPSPLGEPLRRSWVRMHEGLTDDLVRAAERTGLVTDRRRVGALAEIVMGLTSNATETLRYRRVDSRRGLARMLAVMTRAVILDGQGPPPERPRRRRRPKRAAR